MTLCDHFTEDGECEVGRAAPSQCPGCAAYCPSFDATQHHRFARWHELVVRGNPVPEEFDLIIDD